MRLINFLLIALLMPPLMACQQSIAPPPEIEGPLFCDVEEVRPFTREEAEYRAANFPDNLRRDIKTNETFRRECESDL